MADILAIVSKAVFEKEARSLAVGDTWSTSAYVSANPGLAPLADGGSLFLVTVRPDAVLWLVAILVGPKSSKGAWRAAVNSAPIRDITALISKIKFASGKRLVRDAKLGMSLQTPRAIDAATAALLTAKGGKSPAPAARATTEPTPSDHPPGVPGAATWSAIAESWSHGTRDDQGSRQGTWRYWRADGTLQCECPFVDDEPHGINRRFHPDGTTASEGTWRDGKLYDTVVFRGPKKTDEAFAPDAAPSIVRVEYLSTDGYTNRTIRFYTAKREVDRTGEPLPKRPAAVPDTARYFPDMTFKKGVKGGWVDGSIERGTEAKINTWRWWTPTGELVHTERYNELGRDLGSFPAGKPDPTEEKIENFLAMKGEHPMFTLAREWSRDVHEAIRPRLAKIPMTTVLEYLELLERHVERYARGWTINVPQWAEIVEVVADWERRKDQGEPIERWTVYAFGSRAAFELRDKSRLQRWWKALKAIALPRKRPSGPWWPLLDELDAHGRERKAIEDYLAGKDAAKPNAEILIRDPKTKEQWLYNRDANRSYYFDGKRYRDSDVWFDDHARHDIAKTAYASQCDERLVIWPGKHGWLVLQRYGRYVLWHQGQYYTSRGQAEATKIISFKATSPAQAQRLMQLIRIAQPKAARVIDPWFDPKVGVITRDYTGEGLTSLGVQGNKHVRRHWDTLYDIETFDSHEAAIVAAEQLEIERLHSGSSIERYNAVLPKPTKKKKR